MPKNVNWSAVLQSVTDFWLPTFGWILGIVVVISIILIIKWFIYKRK